ncbi:MAG: protein translocase subunit SecD [Clostridia bacterium]|nr:protein translocase subunit SecD [Clostridia bacterium]
MRAKSIVKLILSLVIVAILVVFTATGMQFGSYQMMPITDNIKLGLDIAGGSYVEYQAVEGDNDLSDISTEDVDTTIAILRQRAADQSYTEAVVTYMNNGRFRVELPDVKDPNEASQLLGQTAKLTFAEPDGTLVVDGSQIKNATYKFGQTSENGGYQHYVDLEFTSEGAEKFADATSRLIGQSISINLDENLVSAPVVQSAITDGKAVITIGSAENAEEEARNLASLIRSGHLPFGLKEVGLSTVSATLGQNSFSKALLAGLISLIVIAVFMIVIYRLLGLVAAIALGIYALLTVLVLGVFGVNLTLPGIAGVVLSFGMAVDANVIIFERIKEEMKNGKTLRAAVDAGFHRATTAIIDANVTTLISSAVLWWLGSGTVKGFAVTLFLGVVVSMFTAIFVTKFILNQLIELNIKNRKLYVGGVK